ncbi:2-keto-4-pentenoate hydratase [Nocardiopsis ganjiahuensis]|uniref:2-keto-4-pentenoate hydratase n=1 Tax=Nocardiopsis ganjiahuensis TaxID=239984 RepID=UPI00034D8906|nr:fumarylacetoacetate hydrolase family protein [Nocardiopsis ganjiahuensis]
MPLSRERARALYRARATREPVEPFTDADPALGTAEGYEIQRELVSMLLADGEEIVGYKVGLTSVPAREQMGVDSPDHGPVLASAVLSDGATVPLDRFVEPRIEAEIAFRIGSRLQGPGVTLEQARAAIARAHAGLEIVDSRIAGWRIRSADTIADLASTAAVAVSGHGVAVDALEPRLVEMVLTRNGEVVGTGTGAEALGDPVAVVAWLANELGEHGAALEPGHLVMTGSLHGAVPMADGDVFTAEFDGLGSITLKVVRSG